MDRGDALKYLVLAVIFFGLVTSLIVLRGGLTGFVVFEDSGSGFNGTFTNTTYNGSDIVLSGDNTTGEYISRVFDAGADSLWTNITSVNSKPNAEILYAVDGTADVWKSTDLGGNWSLLVDDYTGAEGNGITYMTKNSSGSFIILFDTDVWTSDDEGVSWIKVNDDFNPSDSNGGQTIGIDNSDRLYAIDGSEDVYQSNDSGVSFSRIIEDLNQGGQNVVGMTVNSSDTIFIVNNQADIWRSNSTGNNWTKVNDDYNGGNNNAATDMFVNSSNDLFILHSQDLWYSIDSGVNWTLINDDFNGGTTGNGQVLYIDSNDYIYIVDGNEHAYRSEDSGASFFQLANNFNGGNGNVFGFSSLSSPTNISFQVMNCSSSDCSDGTYSTVDLTNINLTSRYFRYKVVFTSPAAGTTSYLTSINVDSSVLNTAPSVSIAVPQDGAAYGTNESLGLNYSATDVDSNLESCWYNINGTANVTIASCANTTFNVQGDGDYFIAVYANDSLGEIVNDSVSFSVLVGAPAITLHYPIDVYFNHTDGIVMNYTPTDANLDTCELLGNFTGTYEVNQSDSGVTSGSVNSFSLDLVDGGYIWNIQCNDTTGNSAVNGNKTFHVDTTDPVVSLSEPSGDKTSRDNIDLTFTATDLTPLTCQYNLTSSIGTPISSNVDVSDCSSTKFSVSADGDFVLYFIANDSAGHSVLKSSNFSVDTSSGSSGDSGGTSGGGGGGGGGGSGGGVVVLNTRLEISGISDLVLKAGDEEILSVSVKNAGSRFLNNCRLKIGGDISGWTNSEQVEGIAPGENVDFILTLIVPEDVSVGDEYGGDLEVSCDEGSLSKGISVSIPGGAGFIIVGELNHVEGGLDVSYTFDASGIVGSEGIVEIWIENQDGVEIKRVSDVFDIDKELIERSIFIELDKVAGIHSVYFALSSDLNNFIRESVVLGETVGTGLAIAGLGLGNRVVGYIVFTLLVLVGIFFGFRTKIMNLVKRKKHK